MESKHHGLLPFRGIDHLCHVGSNIPGRFGRLFDNLPPLYIDPLQLHDLGKAGGKMEDKGVPTLTRSVPAGLIFFGQFIDHDITLDESSSLSANNDPIATENIRTPTLDMDCIYGDGPGAHPYLYDGAGKLLTGADYADPSAPDDLKAYDLPRNPRGTAIIGDPRNDENRVISQLQLGFLRFHNRVVDVLASQANPPHGIELFEQARRVVTWHYQWIVINDFLRTLCGSWMVDDILCNGRKVYRPECHHDHAGPYIPIEFSTAIYRFGHTMIPQKFMVKPGGPQHDVFGASLGMGFTAVTNEAQVVEWSALLDSGNGEYERANKLDAKLAKDLLDLPFMPASTPAFERSLAVRNLLRAQSFLLPSGEQVASALMDAGAAEVTPEMVGDVRDVAERYGLGTATPLWFYVLAEGQAVGRMDEKVNGQIKFTRGEGLGPVGARLVAEVIIGLMELDPRSFLGSQRNWSPLNSEDKLGANGITSLYQLLTDDLS